MQLISGVSIHIDKIPARYKKCIINLFPKIKKTSMVRNFDEIQWNLDFGAVFRLLDFGKVFGFHTGIRAALETHFSKLAFAWNVPSVMVRPSMTKPS